MTFFRYSLSPPLYPPSSSCLHFQYVWLAFLRSREVDGPWRPRSDFIAGLSPILTATHLASEVDGLKRTLAGLSLVFPTTYLAHEVDGPWRPQGDRIAGLSLHRGPRLLLLAHQPEFSQIKPKFICIRSVADPDPGSSAF